MLPKSSGEEIDEPKQQLKDSNNCGGDGPDGFAWLLTKKFLSYLSHF
jgi:hypothetical protein